MIARAIVEWLKSMWYCLCSIVASCSSVSVQSSSSFLAMKRPCRFCRNFFFLPRLCGGGFSRPAILTTNEHVLSGIPSVSAISRNNIPLFRRAITCCLSRSERCSSFLSMMNSINHESKQKGKMEYMAASHDPPHVHSTRFPRFTLDHTHLQAHTGTHMNPPANKFLRSHSLILRMVSNVFDYGISLANNL